MITDNKTDYVDQLRVLLTGYEKPVFAFRAFVRFGPIPGIIEANNQILNSYTDNTEPESYSLSQFHIVAIGAVLATIAYMAS